jgi:hypothetical protein
LTDDGLAGKTMTPGRQTRTTLLLAMPRAALLAVLLALLVALLSGLVPGTAHGQKSSSSKTSKPSPAIDFSGKLAVRMIYDDNFIHYSGDDLADFGGSLNPGRFLIKSPGDWITRPRLELTGKSKLLTGKNLQVRLRISSWWYTQNSIKNNNSYQVRLKHPGFGRDSFELAFYYAPSAYLRSFRDLPPNSPRSDPWVYEPYSYTSNSLSLTYWRRLSSRFDGKLALAHSWRFYNQAFMENDNWEWRFGGYLTWRFVKRFKLRGEYIYSNAKARAADEVGETPEISDNSDPSYERDSYKVTLFWTPKKPFYLLRSVTTTAQFQIYYFTSQKPYHEDEYHVGRQDRIGRFEITSVSPPLLGPVRLEGGYRYTLRTSTAAFDTDNSAIGDDKDYKDNRFWIGAEYLF